MLRNSVAFPRGAGHQSLILFTLRNRVVFLLVVGVAHGESRAGGVGMVHGESKGGKVGWVAKGWWDGESKGGKGRWVR